MCLLGNSSRNKKSLMKKSPIMTEKSLLQCQPPVGDVNPLFSIEIVRIRWNGTEKRGQSWELCCCHKTTLSHSHLFLRESKGQGEERWINILKWRFAQEPSLWKHKRTVSSQCHLKSTNGYTPFSSNYELFQLFVIRLSWCKFPGWWYGPLLHSTPFLGRVVFSFLKWQYIVLNSA